MDRREERSSDVGLPVCLCEKFEENGDAFLSRHTGRRAAYPIACVSSHATIMNLERCLSRYQSVVLAFLLI